MNAKIRLRIISGESKSMIHSICKIQMMVRVMSKMCEIGKVWMALVQFQKSFFNFIFYVLNELKMYLD